MSQSLMLWTNTILDHGRDMGCPGVALLMPRTEPEGVCSETYGHPRPYKREGPEDGVSRLWEGPKRRRFRNKYRLAKKKFYVEQLSTKVDKKDRDISRRDARDTGGLGNGGRAIALEFLTTLD